MSSAATHRPLGPVIAASRSDASAASEPATTVPLVRRDGSVATPLWEQTHFVLAVREVFLASRAPDDESYRRTVERSLHHGRLEGRARWIAVLGVDPDSGRVSWVAADGVDATTTVGRDLGAIGLPVEVLVPPRSVHRAHGRDLSGPLALLCRTDEDLACVALWGSDQLLGVVLAAVDARAGSTERWLSILADYLAWTAKGRTWGGATPGLGLPSVREVTETAPDARWMAVALELDDLPIAVSAYPGQMSYVSSKGRAFMHATGVQDYAADIEGAPGNDHDEMAWRAQVMISVLADPEGQGRSIVTNVPDGTGGEVATRFVHRIVRHRVTGAIDRLVMAMERVSTRTDAETDDAPSEHEPGGGERSAERSVEGLTERQLDVATALVRGDRPSMIAEELDVSIHTVRGHISALYRHTGASDLGELIDALRTQLS